MTVVCPNCHEDRPLKVDDDGTRRQVSAECAACGWAFGEEGPSEQA